MRLSDCFVELISYVLYFVKTVGKRQGPFDQIRSDIERLMQQSRNSISYGGITDEDYESARFAICAWIDEAIMSSSWNEKLRWQKEPLQRLYYQTTNAGEIFFDRLNAIGPHQKEVREVYYLCLAMGFAGRYCNEGDNFLLDQLRTSNLKVLAGSSVGIPDLDKGELFTEAYPINTAQEVTVPMQKRFSLFNIVCAGSPVLLFIVLFLIYHFVLNNIGETLFSMVQ